MRAHLFSLTVLAGLAASALAAPTAHDDTAALIEAGRRIYEEGTLPSGEPVQATREASMVVSGPGAACILCHRRSGMGGNEGLAVVPPISAPALFEAYRAAGHQPRQAKGIEYRNYPFRTRPPYDENSLGLAIRQGISPTGYRFQYLMPRYALDDDAMRALVAYLRTLSAQPSPGVEDRVIHFATVVVPGSAPEKRKAYIEVLKACFAERYPEPAQSERSVGSGGERKGWRLHVWELEGPPADWGLQLADRYSAQPVFALVSGLGPDDWAPVHRFCEDTRLPCLFPNTDAPGTLDEDVYSFYFSKGVSLEAQALAQVLRDGRATGIQRVVQVSRSGTAGAAAAAALRQSLADSGIEVVDLAFESASAIDTIPRLRNVDALVLWLREADVAALVRQFKKPPDVGLLMLSGSLAGGESAPLSAPWKREARMMYPFDPPARWQKRIRFNLRPWLTKQGLQLVDERLQGNTLSACNLMFEGMFRLQGRFHRDYLLETVELSASTMSNAAAASAYPRFVLGTNQRFGSKGVYVARFASPEGHRLIKDGDWITP